ncbi:hypothetical protein [Mesorhizobium sp. CA4]|uniref:hypothetical protein n=1 Tax=Mesorhizobium sp. CA4 TaxID=588499 RepID=UPI001CD0A805|nr:hypothetical protein [Mesorhizobium sp. CA4]MBZ9820821.1 hypothetical protein [Mesorhizobium sp. CA4]
MAAISESLLDTYTNSDALGLADLVKRGEVSGIITETGVGYRLREVDWNEGGDRHPPVALSHSRKGM